MARDALRALVGSKMRGYIRAFALNVLRHAEYCASYHAANGAAGITQPTHIDPEAGPAALAVALKSMKRPHDRAFVLGNVPRNGLGNSFLELRDSLPKLGLSGRWVSADKEGLLRLFRFNEGAAMVAHVERDHYVAVTAANQSGVSYMCVDCGPWPGGSKKVTWKQWARMDASNFLAISRKGSAFDQALAILPEKAHTRVQRVPGPTAQPGSVPTGAAQRIVAELVGVAAMSYFSICGVNAGSLPDCTPCWECLDFCPIWTSPAPPGGGANFDPVNLATLSHSYTPDADITVYNPTGPSVAWGHSYHSNTVVTPNGYGMGWSHPYLWTIDTPAFTNDGSISSSGEGFRLKEPGSAEVLFGVRNITAPGPNNPGPVNWPFAAGYPFVVTWQWNTTDSCDEFILTRLDRSKWTFRRVSGAPNSNARNLYFPVKIEDRNGNYIKLNWSQHLFQGLNPFEFTVNVAIGGLDSIKDSSNNTLLQVDYDSTGKVVTKVTGKSPGASPRYVYYVVELKQHTNPGNQDLVANYELTQVSQVTTSTSAAANYTYGYEWIGNGYVRPSDNLDELVPYLYTVTRPSPTGSGTTTTTMKHGYEGYIQWIEDGNGYVTRFLSDESTSSTSETTVASYVNLNASTPVAQYTVGYSNSQDNLRMTSLKNAAGEIVATWGFGGSNSASPKRPSSVTVNFSGSESKTWNFAYDQYGQPTYSLTPKGISHTTTYSTPSGFPFPVPTQTSTSSGTNTIATTNISYHSNGLVSEVETVVPEGVSVPGTPATQ